MAKDLRGNEIKPGDFIFYNGIVCEVKDVSEGGLLAANTPMGKSISGMQLPGSITALFDFQFNVGQNVNCLVLKKLPETGN